jgi:hypothetical protein
MVGMALLGHTAEVSFEDCVHSEKDGPNPDVIVRFDDLRVGIACKSITTTNREGIFERIRSGVRQITRAHREKMCDTGLVLLDISSILEHDALYMLTPPIGVWYMGDIPDVIKERTAGAFARALGIDDPQKIGDVIGDLYTRPFTDLGPTPVTPIAEPCVLVYGHSLMIGANTSVEGPVYAKVLIDYYFNDQGRTKGLVTELNKRLHGQ